MYRKPELLTFSTSNNWKTYSMMFCKFFDIETLRRINTIIERLRKKTLLGERYD